MVLWFAGLTLWAVWLVFRSPALDYRMVALGAVLPVVEVVFGRPVVLHTLAGAVGALTLVMVGTQRKRLVRRRLLGVPIGLFFHLVLDGVWTDANLFWWPVTGLGFESTPLPEFDRFPLVFAMEAVGAAALWWWWKRWNLADPQRRNLFVTTGRLPRDLAGEEPSGC